MAKKKIANKEEYITTVRPSGYVVYYCERMRDGTEEGARCFEDKKDALEWIDRTKE